MNQAPAETPRQLYLPDFCRARAVLGIVLICELTALVVSLARNEVVLGFWADLAAQGAPRACQGPLRGSDRQAAD